MNSNRNPPGKDDRFVLHLARGDPSLPFLAVGDLRILQRSNNSFYHKRLNNKVMAIQI